MKIKIDVSDNKNIWFTSDFHLFHKKVIEFDNRPFIDKNGGYDVEAMHLTIIHNWNKVVNKNDVVFYLCDLCMTAIKKVQPIISQLNGTIHFIMGNHDKYEDIVKLGLFKSINDYVDLNITGVINLDKNKKDKDGNIVKFADIHFCLMHFPIHSWNRKKHGSVMVHGHCHGNLHHDEDDKFYDNGKRAIDIGCNIHDYTPVSYLEIMRKFNINV